MKRALIVDDNEDNRYFLQALLQWSGFAATTAVHGGDALTQARAAPPDFVISDLLMPVMDGYTLLREWKTDPALASVPFIVYTATYTDAKDEKLALDLGADAFIIKPQEPDALMKRIRAVLDKPPEEAARTFRHQDEGTLLSLYNEVLIKKLEKRNIQLEKLVAELETSQNQIKRLHQFNAALTKVNQAIVHMETQNDLFRLACRCAVDFGGMAMAWIARQDGPEGLMRPVASYGTRLDYLNGMAFDPGAATPEGQGPVGRAFHEGHPVIVNDYFTDPLTAAWTDRVPEKAWNACAAFPIRRGGRAFAVFSIYHTESGAFDTAAISLFEEMADDISFALDNLDREVRRQEAEESMRLASSIFETNSMAILVTDADNKIAAANPTFAAITGYAAQDLLGRDIALFRSRHHDKAFYTAMWEEIRATGQWQGEIWGRKKNGDVFPSWLTLNTILNADGSVHRRVAQFNDITKWKKTEELIWRQANFDPLTGLPNRQMFMDRLNHDIRKAHHTELPLALMFLDLDHFKEINDTLGHELGDALIRQAAERIVSSVRESDTVARLGGDEFTVILAELADPGSVERVAQDILQSLAKPFYLNGEESYISGSIGITLYPADAQEIDVLLKNADQAMYAAKQQGRNRYHYFTPAMQEAALRRRRMVHDLRNALAERQFWIAYQPIVDLSSGAVRKAEALIRWQHPARGLIGPAEFIPIAEETGLIVDIGNWVFRETASQVRQWREKYHPDFQISVNKSPVQFEAESNGQDSWCHYLRDMSLSGQSITVEITEGLLLDANANIINQLYGLRDAGIQVAIDDFGTGYSSLAYLKKFDIDYLKIDQSFTRNLAAGSQDLALCEAIIVMAHKLGIKVIAEGVETEQQKSLLRDAGCDFGQGYLFSKPVMAPEFDAFLARAPR